MEYWNNLCQETGMAVDTTDVCRLLDSIGQIDPGAPASAILRLVNRHVAVADCTVMSFAPTENPRVISVAGDTDTCLSLHYASGYVQRLFQLDRIQLHLRSILPQQEIGRITVHRQTLAQIIDAELQHLCRNTFDAVDCAAITIKSDHREWITVNLFRHCTQGLLDKNEIDTLLRLAPLIATTAARHCRLDAGGRGAVGDSSNDGIDELCARLTTRERQVIQRILDGTTVEQIAADLGLKPTTVITYRSRAYDKLGVSSRHELFAAALRQGNTTNRRRRTEISRHMGTAGNLAVAPAA